MSLRIRLTLYYTAVLAVTLFSASLFLYWIMEYSLAREVDRSLVARAEEVVRTARLFTHMPMHRMMLPDVSAFASPGTYIQVVDASGIIVAQSRNLAPESLPFTDATLARAAAEGPFLETVQVDGQALRLYNRPLVAGSTFFGILQIGQSLAPMQSTLAALRWLLILISIVTLILAGSLGFLLARAALAPIDRLTQVAAAITDGADLGRRVPYNGPPDEVGRLAATFNAMLGRLQEAYRRLEEAYAAQKRFVADASHELRTPLTTIRGNIDLLRRLKEADPQAQEEILRDAASEAERMTRLVNNLLLLARADAGRKIEKQPLELKPLVEEVARQAPHLGEASFAAEGLERLEAARVSGNADFLKQLLFILLDNAFKYTPPGGRVILRALAADGRWGLQVADTGRGIPAAQIPYIFERFYRADPSREGEGAGLGLAIARWIVEEHGGSIEVESEVGKGSTFTVWLPAIG